MLTCCSYMVCITFINWISSIPLQLKVLHKEAQMIIILYNTYIYVQQFEVYLLTTSLSIIMLNLFAGITTEMRILFFVFITLYNKISKNYYDKNKRIINNNNYYYYYI